MLCPQIERKQRLKSDNNEIKYLMFYKRQQIKGAVLRKRFLRETTFLLGVFICYFLCTSKESNQGYSHAVINHKVIRGRKPPEQSIKIAVQIPR